MTDQEYPEPLVVESPTACPGLERLPRLPVRVLVLSAPSADDPARRGLADRLVRRADELGVADGVVIVAQELQAWTLAPGGTQRKRFDVVLLRPTVVPAAADSKTDPDPKVVDVLSRVLGDLETRFWVLDPPTEGSDDADDTRRMKLCRALVKRGAPPAVLIPPGWEPSELLCFHEEFLERILHDAPLDKAVSRATDTLRPVPAIFQPAGGRHGLDLGRLLEDHRHRIDDESTGIRVFDRELQATQPPPEAGASPLAVWTALAAAAARRREALEAVRTGCEEINRDRDPAGWSRLAANIDELRSIEEDRRRDGDQLQALRLVSRGGGG